MSRSDSRGFGRPRFGLARGVSPEAGLTQTDVIVGTPAFMAPEQRRGGAVDHRCDLFIPSPMPGAGK